MHTKLLLYFQEHDDTCILIKFLNKMLQKKPTRTIVWIKSQNYATIAPLSIFSLGKGREILTSQTLLILLKAQSAPSDLKNPNDTLV